MQTIWTVLPNGGDATTLKVSLYATLRVSPGTVGSNFPTNNFANQILGASGLKLTFQGGTDVPLTLDTSPVVPDLWTRLFPPATPVYARVTPDVLKKRTIVTYPTDVIHQQIIGIYTVNAVVAADPALQGERNPLVSAFRGMGRDLSAADLSPPDVTAIPANLPFYQATRFYRRYKNRPNPPATAPAALPPPITPTPDLNQALSMLADHPYLLRQLGLIIDGTIPRSQVPTGRSLVQLKGALTPNDQTPTSTTQVFLDPSATDNTAFRLAAQDDSKSDVSGGFLKLGDTTNLFDYQVMDIDSAALKVADYTVNYFQGDISSNPPSLKTAGIVVAHKQRASRVSDRIGRSVDLENNPTGPFYGDDLVRGYRLDVRRVADGIWRSLCFRHGSFVVGADRVVVPAVGEIHDEGCIKAGAATSDDSIQPTDADYDTRALYVHQALFSWDGWSQVAPAPGKSIQFQQNPPAGQSHEVVQQVTNTAATQYQVEQHFKAEPGTLPKLRYGDTYQLRARVVDLAGNSLPVSTPVTDPLLMSPPILFQRHEPVPQPELVLRRAVVEGESVEHIVIRSQVGTPTNAANVFFPINDRFVAPPKASFDMALMHGKIDPFFPLPPLAYNLGLKSEGTLLDTQVYDTLLGIKTPVFGMQVINTPEATVAGAAPVFPTERGVPLQTGQYVIHTEPVLRLPYLPDPLAAGFTVTDGPAIESKVTGVGSHSFAYIGNWPDLISPTITVRNTPAATPSVVSDLGGISVYLPPGTMVPLLLSSSLTPGALDVLALWSYLPAAAQQSVHDAAMAGLLTVLSPTRQIMAVNAVEKPTKSANFTTITADQRTLGDTFVKLTTVVASDSHSTGQIDIEATWTNQVDRLSDPAPTTEAHSGHVYSVRIGYDDASFITPSGGLDTQPKHDFGDTKHRLVQYRPDATTRYKEYFPAALTSVPQNIIATGVPSTVNILSSARPLAPDVLYVVPTFQWVSNVNLGVLTPTNTTSQRVGRSVRVYLDRPWFSSGDGEVLAVVLPGVTPLDDRVRKYVSEWGADPAWNTAGSGPVPDLTPANFTNALAQTEKTLVIAEDTTIQVQVVTFPVTYNANRKVWYADIVMSDVASYTPFVRFAFARYQHDSEKNVELSPIVKADFIQLANDRTATLKFAGPLSLSINVSVSGIAGRNRLGNLMTTLPIGPAPTPPAGYKFDRNAGQGRVVTAQVEQLSVGQANVEWVPVGTATVLPSFTATSSPGNQVMWSGTVPVPVRPLLVTQRRLVIKEYELFPADIDVADASVPVPLPPASPHVRGRIAYLDIIPFNDLDFL